jgi:magnesium transporter
MINAFELQQGRLRQFPIESAADLARCSPVWVDFAESTEEERAWAESAFGVVLPETEDLGDIESSARFFEEDNGELHIRSDFLREGESGGESIPVAFVLKDDIVFSSHAVDLPQFRLVRLRARRQPGFVNDAKDVLLEIYAADAEFSADILEQIYDRLDDFSERVLRASLTDEEAGAVLTHIAREEDLNGHIRRNLMDTRRAVSFLMRKRLLNAEQHDDARQILRDIESLDGHTDFLFDKLNFLMDATVGFININQNKIIKIFSVAAVAMLPPTLIASIYGMNFERLPELRWEYGYPFALALMVVSVVLPFWYFHRKGWLK